MSKQVKSLITKELSERFKDLDGVGVINPRGINAIKNNQIRRRLHEKGLRMTVVKNTLARRATTASKLKGFEKLLDGPSAVIYGKAASISAVARTLLDEKKADATIELRGMFFDGELYIGDKGVEQVSKLPTREEAIGNLVGLILGPGSKLAGALKGPGGKLGALLKAIEEKAAAVPEAAPAAEAAPTA
jgi:large subunit ribosomal protein L10